MLGALEISMEKNEIKDTLFDVLNDTDNLPIHDIVVDDRNNIVNVYLTDGTRFSIHVEKCGAFVRYNRRKIFCGGLTECL